MRVFLISCLAAGVIAAGAAIAMNAFIPNNVATAFSTTGVRI